MSKKAPLIETLSLKGLEIAPSQVCGGIRIVPLLRRQVNYDLRLFKRTYRDDLTMVSLAGKPLDPGLKYLSYVPHGLVLSWSEDGSPVAALGGQLLNEGQHFACGPTQMRVLHRMAKRESSQQLRFLPLHLAMEGFLSLYFSGPEIIWKDYSRLARSHGLVARSEWSVSGRAIAGLEDALRVFEIHDHQVGVLLFVADALASTFVTPTPEDYRALHTSLLADFYGELIFEYGLVGTANPLETKIDATQIESLAALQEAVAKMRADWASFQGFMASNLLARDVKSQRLYTAGPFTLQRFITDLQLKSENHIGEAIIHADGQLEYLKTYRLSEAQTRRAYLLSQLAAHGWNLDDTAAALNQSREDLVYRLEKAGFGYLLNNQVREQARSSRRRR